jgi:ribose 5-phosphate isomerase A
MANENEKQAAARASLQYIQDGQVIGLGTGSTAIFLVELLAERRKAGLYIRAIHTSARTRDTAVAAGIPLTTFERDPVIDVAIDGADEIGPQLELIKGGGGALLREKIVASAARTFIVIADSSKQVPVLGSFPLPLEVVPFAQPLVARRVAALGAEVTLRMAPQQSPFITDEGHHILDCRIGRIADPAKHADELHRMPGIVEHGLFLDMADFALIGHSDHVAEIRPARSRPCSV